MRYIVNDDLHDDLYLPYPTIEAAMVEIRRRVALPWDHDDNQAPCASWKTCERQYSIYEYDEETGDECRRLHICTICADGLFWAEGFEDELIRWQAV